MPKPLASIAASGLLAVLLPACAVATDPGSAPAPAGEDQAGSGERAARPGVHGENELLVSPLPPICIPPVTAMTGAWSCGASGVRTGEKSATTTAGYTNNCSGRATVEFAIPSCPSPAPPEYDEIMVSAVGVATLSAPACAAAYLDYTIWGESSATNTWAVTESGRVYGTFSNGYCDLAAPSYYPASADFSHFEITADAYEPLYLRLFGGVPVQFGFTPVNVFFDASFIQ